MNEDPLGFDRREDAVDHLGKHFDRSKSCDYDVSGMVKADRRPEVYPIDRDEVHASK